jgi:hypothetical protein
MRSKVIVVFYLRSKLHALQAQYIFHKTIAQRYPFLFGKAIWCALKLPVAPPNFAA